MRGVIQSKQQWFLLGIPLFITIAYTLYWVFNSPGVEGGQDSYEHYLIARYAWKHPELFLHNWGKPIFTLFASIPAQLGIKALQVFNVLCVGISGLVIFQAARSLNLKAAPIAGLLVILSPIFLVKSISGLTEPWNAVLVALLILSAVKRKYVWVALLTGLLPYARSEGYMIMAVIFFWLAYHKQWKAIPFLLLGSLVYHVAGWIIFEDPYYIYSSNPYIKAQVENKQFCGSGSLFTYLRKSHIIWGAIGSLFMAIGFFRLTNRSKINTANIDIIILCAINWMLFFGIHSFIWWKGLMGSCGYERVMIVILPFAGIIAAYGLEGLLNRSSTRKWQNFILTICVLFMSISSLKLLDRWTPIAQHKENILYEEAAAYLNETYPELPKLYYLYSYLSVLLDVDPNNTDQVIKLWGFKTDWVKSGEVIIWDSHFGPHEGQTPLEYLQNSPKLKEIKVFKPQEFQVTLGGHNFEIHIFEVK